mgnify:FL=1
MRIISVDHGNIHQIEKIEIQNNTFSEGKRKYITFKFYENTMDGVQLEHELSVFSDKDIEPDINILLGEC